MAEVNYVYHPAAAHATCSQLEADLAKACERWESLEERL